MIGGSEVFLIILAVLLLFGSKKIPELAKGLGQGLKEFKKATADIKKEIENAQVTQEVKEIKKDINENPLVKDINTNITEIKDNLKG
jgi:sec-independent protein translocase protein TatA